MESFLHLKSLMARCDPLVRNVPEWRVFVMSNEGLDIGPGRSERGK
jgi:hypothetical protein